MEETRNPIPRWRRTRLLGAESPAAPSDPLASAFEALGTYDWDKDLAPLKPIDEALLASRDDAAAREALEIRLAAVLATSAPRAAKDFVCRRLSRFGARASVPQLSVLLGAEDLSHMARYALERMPSSEAAAALRAALPATTGKLRVGVIRSLGVRRDVDSVPRLRDLLADADPQVASAAAAALGQIGTSDAAKALREATPAGVRPAAAEASLQCAERLIARGQLEEARAMYESLDSQGAPEHVRLAARLGLASSSRKG